MKLRDYIGIVLMAVMVGCTPPGPLSEEEGTPTTSPRPSPGGEGVASRALENIDSLMWQQADSALKVMMEFAASPEAESLNEFEGHYCQVLIAELLYKNDYGQSNREEVLKAVHYFDSIVNVADGRNADARCASVQRGVAVREREAFLAARAHYMNGVGYYEQGDLVNACTEYLNTLRIMESHFSEKELVDKKARFMALTYGRLIDMFSHQLIPEPAIYCCKQYLVYNQIAPTSLNAKANILYQIGLQYHILQKPDSVVFYYDVAFNALHDRNTIVYRDLMASQAVFDYYEVHDTIKALDSLKSMAAQAESETERISRYSTIGDIYYDAGQLDSAKVYLEPGFGFANDAIGKKLAAKTLHDIAFSEGDTLKANQYAQFSIEDIAATAENQKRVSQLNELFQQHLQWEQERAEAERQQIARLRRNRTIVVVSVLVVVAALLAWLFYKRRMKQQRDEASQQMEAVQEAHRLEKASMSGRLKRSNQELRELKDQMRQQAGNGAPKQEAQAVSFNDEPICRLIMERVNEGQFKAQMDCKLYQDYALGKEQVMALREAADRHFNQFTVRLAKAYPNLTKGDLDYCCLYLLGLSDADISALMQRAYATVSERSRKIKSIFGTEEPLSVALMSFASGSASI